MSGITFPYITTDGSTKNITVRLYQEPDKDELMNMVLSLYTEDSSPVEMNAEKIERTIQKLMGNTDEGAILMIESGSTIVGYTILINYWSNELGGNIVNIDELFIKPGFRGKGIATNLIKQLINKRIYGSIAIQLEVTPDNNKAAALYRKIGFKPARNQYYRYFPMK